MKISNRTRASIIKFKEIIGDLYADMSAPSFHNTTERVN